MNPCLDALQPYPFERLAALHRGLAPPAGVRPISLSLGEPQHPTPALITDALRTHVQGYGRYPLTRGEAALRKAIAEWLGRRFDAPIDPEREVLPVTGTREALFAIAQATIDAREAGALVLSPNPFYQIYEGAALLAGAGVRFVNLTAAQGFAADWSAVSETDWARIRLVYACSPNNPTGRVMTLEEWRTLFALSDRFGFLIVADECYSEIYFDEAAPPLGALAAARQLGRAGYPRLVAMGSLSKRSNAPGLRSGYCAGDARVIEKFLLYRTYHGSAMSLPVQMASIAAWSDEAHVRENRVLYREKFSRFHAIVSPYAALAHPEAGFYFWMPTPCDAEAFSRMLYSRAGVLVLPGPYLARDSGAGNPGAGHVRLALVATVADAEEAAHRLAEVLKKGDTLSICSPSTAAIA
jgi:N-succinyldiaminopimelate aminotransferase